MVKPFRLPGDDFEYTVMVRLWELGAASVRELHEQLAAPAGLAYTTTAKVVDRLRAKGLLTRRLQGQAFVYRPRLGRDEVERERARQAVKPLFSAAPQGAVAALVGAVAELDPALLDELERVVAAARRKSGNGA